MPWSKRLAYRLGLKPRPDPMARFSRPDADERIRSTLARNPAIDGNLEIVNEIMSVGEVVGFLQGEDIIEQESNGDDVFFLLAGDADIIVNRRKRTFRSAPNQIGEMAAVDPGKPRSATIRVRSTTVCALRISGDLFRMLWRNHADFKGRLQVEMLSRHREQLVAAQVTKENISVLWSALSIGVAVVTGGISWFYFDSAEWTLSARLAATGGVSVLTFFLFLLQNPAFIWRRSFSILLCCLVAKSIFDASFAFEANQGFGSLQFKFQSSGNVIDFATSMGNSLPLIVLMGMCMRMDYLASRK